jgi:integrase
MEEYRSMKNPTRKDFEEATRRHFKTLLRDLDRPRDFDPDFLDLEVGAQEDMALARIYELNDQLTLNQFDPMVVAAARAIMASIELDFDELTERKAIVAGQLAARAEREYHHRFIHSLTALGRPFAGDELFTSSLMQAASSGTGPIKQGPIAHTEADTQLSSAVAEYLPAILAVGIGISHHDETKRLLEWLKQDLGPTTPIQLISKADVRRFYKGITQMDRTKKGQARPFKERQTANKKDQLSPATVAKYCHATRAFFDWAVNEYNLPHNPAEVKLPRLMKQEPKTPPPFSSDELKRLFASPLYSGSHSTSRLTVPGPNTSRLHDWWFGVLALHSGLRAGELNQLEAANFHFDSEIPYFSVIATYENGSPKNVKNHYSVRDVPLHPNLLVLGLRQFVERWKGKSPDGRLFRYRLGGEGKSSEGASQFWRNYLRATDLWCEGRSTHMFRHTVADGLRANGASDEDIGAILGHSGRTITSHYGGGQPLSRKAETLKRLDYGFDVVAALGGPYDKKRHSP